MLAVIALNKCMNRNTHILRRFPVGSLALLAMIMAAPAPAVAQTTPTPAEACEAFRTASSDRTVSLAPLLDRADLGRRALVACREYDADPAGIAAYGFALVAAGQGSGVRDIRNAATAGNPDALY